MDTQGRNELKQFNPERNRQDARAKTAGEAVAESLMAPIFPAPAAPQADAVATRARSWFSVVTVLTMIALAACAAAAVAAAYGPVFTQPMMGP
ncbi:MAG TPA: hypothetical protein VGG01_17560 [Xanthobacteraceae bacterium]|jgi:hypothetical protein